MKRLKKVFVFIDELEALNGVLDTVAEVATKTECRVVFGIVVEPPPWRLMQPAELDSGQWVDTHSEVLGRAIESAIAELRRHELDAELKVYAGEVTRTLVNAVVDEAFDLLIKASQSKSRALLGSNDQRILRHCPCPVAILRPPRPGRTQKVIAALEMNPEDPSDNAINDEIMDAAIRTAMGRFSQLVVIHAWHLQGESLLSREFASLPDGRLDALREEERRAHQEWLQAYVKSFFERLGPEAERFLAPEVRLVKGLPLQALIQQVEVENPEMLVLGSVARTGIQGLLIGNTAESLANMVDCSTLTVKPAGFRSPLEQ